MRNLRSLALGSLLLLAPTVHAEKRGHKSAAAPNKLAVVDDEPMSHDATRAPPADEIRVEALSTRGTEDAQPKTIDRATPTPTAVAVQTALPDAVTHRPEGPAPDASASTASLSDDTVVELAAHQMRHERRALDACADAAQRRNPMATGSVTLRFRVEDRKVVNVSVDKDSLHDATLSSCLVSAGRALNFSLKQASFYWPVSLSPTASR